MLLGSNLTPRLLLTLSRRIERMEPEQRPLMLMVGNLPSRRGLFTAKLCASQILSEVRGVE